MAILLRNLGVTYCIEQRERDALRVLNQAVALAKTLPDRKAELVAGLLNDIGIAYYRLGQPKNADKFFAQSAELVSSAGLPLNAELLNTRGAIQLVQRNYQSAERLLNQALQLQQVSLGPTHPDLTMTLALLGDLYTRTHRYLEAEDRYLQAIDLLRGRGPEFDTRIARLLYSLSATYEAAGRLTDTEGTLAQAVTFARRALNKHDMARIVESYAAILENERRVQEAKDLRLELKRALAEAALVIDSHGRF